MGGRGTGDACRDGGWKDGRMEEEGGMSEDGWMNGGIHAAGRGDRGSTEEIYAWRDGGRQEGGMRDGERRSRQDAIGIMGRGMEV